jgi:hypothetical protein
VQLARVHDRRKERRLATEDEFAGLSDDEPSPMYSPEPVVPAPAAPVSDARAGFDDIT